MWAIIKKEFKQYFLSPIGYIYIGVFMLVYSMTFYRYIFTQQSMLLNQIYGYWLILITVPIMVSLLTMRMFAEERKTGTEQLLLTSPTSITKIVLGKFIAATFVVLIANIVAILYAFILKYFGSPDLKTFFVSFLGFTLFILVFVSFGMFASSLVENQVIAATLSVVFFIASVFIPEIFTKLEFLSPVNAFAGSFLSGTISISSLVLLLSYIVLFFIFTVMVMLRRKMVK